MIIEPKVSVIMSTYNHASFVGKTIESVLSQENVDFEFLIIDDGSRDNTMDIVMSYTDPRIKVLPNKGNRGACIAANDLIERAHGKYIALINSDDYWEGTDKLAIQTNFLDSHPHIGACFGKARFIDKDDNVIKSSDLPFGNVFEQSNRSKGEWLRFFFESGNCICHPTMLIRRSCYNEVGNYNNSFRQLPDYDMWIRLVKKWDIHIFDNIFINFRIMPGENASSQTSANSIRTINEHYLIACDFFDGVSRSDFIAGFSDLFKGGQENIDEVSIEIEKVLLLFSENRWLNRAYSMAALPKLLKLLNSPDHATYLSSYYDIDAHWFHNKMSDVDVLLPKVVAELQIKKGKFDRIFKFLRRLS
ncbi:glycosyltransferase [Aeromonas veronii]|uniref:glycosyltransferase n=1 Tax=Aeromonas veronii TaxID=654 RepID=UPI001CD36CDF|nr:glycosyltransferase [Aeromonas veronii]UBR44333.1 glycosyltransferase [Aeromonas veronii]